MKQFLLSLNLQHTAHMLTLQNNFKLPWRLLLHLSLRRSVLRPLNHLSWGNLLCSLDLKSVIDNQRTSTPDGKITTLSCIVCEGLWPVAEAKFAPDGVCFSGILHFWCLHSCQSVFFEYRVQFFIYEIKVSDTGCHFKNRPLFYPVY